jgi:hypothetical protein
MKTRIEILPGKSHLLLHDPETEQLLASIPIKPDYSYRKEIKEYMENNDLYLEKAYLPWHNTLPVLHPYK